MMAEHHILSLGAGVQSTTLYLLALDGELDGVKFDAAVFADTQEEPQGVYRHLEWLKSLGGPPIVTVTAGKLGDNLIEGHNTTGQDHLSSIPCFIAAREGECYGMVQRQCTNEYKIQVIERWIRRELLGLAPKQRIPADVIIHQYMGFSLDEPGRAARARSRFAMTRWGEVHFPLFDMMMTRLDCANYLTGRVPHPVPKSACVFCPFRSNKSWRELRDTDPEGWARAVEVDKSFRLKASVSKSDFDKYLYVHRSCRPLDEANLGDDQGNLFDMDCEGGCGL